jgi:hypothetical protein
MERSSNARRLVKKTAPSMRRTRYAASPLAAMRPPTLAMPSV